MKHLNRIGMGLLTILTVGFVLGIIAALIFVASLIIETYGTTFFAILALLVVSYLIGLKLEEDSSGVVLTHKEDSYGSSN